MKLSPYPLVLIVLLGCNGDVTDPVPLSQVRLTVVAGDEQTAFAGTELSDPLVVRATVDGKPWKNQVVNFVVTEGGGSVFAGAALTDNKGEAQDFWTLGHPGPQELEVRAVAEGEKFVFATFLATAIESPEPGNIQCLGGDGSWQISGSCQWPTVPRGTTVSVTFRVVTDDLGTVVPGVEVTFEVDPTCLGACENPGTVSPSSAVTDEDGEVTADWTLGPNEGSNRLVASVAGVGGVGVWRTGS